MGSGGAVKYAQINAVVHALYADMLSEDTMHDLAAVDEYNAAVSSLEKTPYGPYLDIPAHLLTPRRIVYQLHIYLAEMYRKLIRMAPQSSQAILAILWQAYEVDNLKAILRGLYHNAAWDQVLFLLSPLNQHNLVSLDQLRHMLETGNISHAIEIVRHTPYYYPLSYALNRYQQENNLFPLEIALDLDYRRRLWQQIDNMHGEDHDYALQLIGTVLDKDKLIWALRFRYYHNLSAEEIINYTLERGYRLKDSDIQLVARGGRIAEILQEKYPAIEGMAEICADIENNMELLEHKLDNDIQARCRKVFRSGPFHIGVTLAYLLMLEYEIRILTAIIEVKATPNEDYQNLAVMLESYV